MVSIHGVQVPSKGALPGAELDAGPGHREHLYGTNQLHSFNEYEKEMFDFFFNE